ncbi:MAG: tetratricopeptide repeat protein [Chloroflexota bacterium]|nr:tetratricopeptide repeat protein [Chloroflexota bacterium]
MQSDPSPPSATIEGSFLITRDINRRGLPLKPILAVCIAALILAIARQQALLLAPLLVLTPLVWAAWRLSKRQRIVRLRMDERALSITGHGYDILLEPPFRFKTGVQRIPPQGKEDETCFVRVVIDVRGKPLVLEEQVLAGRMPPKLDEIIGLSSALGIAELTSLTPFPGTLWSLIQILDSLALAHDTEQLDANIATLFKLGERQMSERIFSQAIDTFTSIIRLSPDSSLAYYSRGAARYFHRSELKKAVNDLVTSLRLEPDQYKCYRMLGLIHAQLGQWVAMRDDCTKAIELLPNSAELYNLRGSACFRLGDYDSALENFQQSIRLDGSRYEAYYNRGLARQQLSLLDEALVDFQYALQLNPEFDAAKRSAISVERRLNQSDATRSLPATGAAITEPTQLAVDSQDSPREQTDRH